MSLLNMLPREILTLVLLASSACAIPYPQLLPVKNSTAFSTTPSPTSSFLGSTAPAWIHIESTATGFEPTATDPRDGGTIDCATALCDPFIIIEQPTATGFETADTPESTTYTPPTYKPDQNPNVVITSTPTVIGVQTSIAPPTDSPQPNNGPGDPNPNGEGIHTEGGGDAQPQHTAGGDLLSDILTRIARPGSQPTQASPTGGSFDEPQQMQQGTAQPTPGLTAPGAQPTLVLGEPITLGPATLTLTPGLSTTVGTGSTAVYVGITINTAGQTIITVSSSGTAVTATITDAPATVTLPRTGFDASITGAARPGEHDSSSAGGVAATTSSKAGAMERIETMDCWVGIVLGIMGLGIAL